MSLPATVTLNVGSPAANVVFANPTRMGKAVQYTAPSPNGDLAGQLSLIVSTETTKSGVERTLRKIVEPVLDSVTGKYDRRREVTIVLSRSRLDDHDANNVGRIQEMGSKLLDNTDVNSACLDAIL